MSYRTGLIRYNLNQKDLNFTHALSSCCVLIQSRKQTSQEELNYTFSQAQEPFRFNVKPEVIQSVLSDMESEL